MRKNSLFSIAGISLFLLFSVSINAEDKIPVCEKLDDRVTGEMIKYSVNAYVNNPLYFGEIACAVKYRATEFCAIEMINFDSSARVFDYYTANELEMSRALFVIDEKNPDSPILAFENKSAAEKYAAEHQGSAVLDYTALVKKEIK
jgi:hypothetical protein